MNLYLPDTISQGFLTFALCPHNDIHSPPDPECFNRHRLLVLDHHRAGGWKEYAWTESRDQQEGRGDFKNKLEYFTVRIVALVRYMKTMSVTFLFCPASASALTELQPLHPPVHVHRQSVLCSGATVCPHRHSGENIPL